MNKIIAVILVVAVAAVTFGAVGMVYAQAPTPQAPVDGTGYGYGMMGAGMRGRMGQNEFAGTGEGVLHDALIAVFAEELGVSVEDLNASLLSGETLADIAFEKGLTVDEFQALMTDARAQAVAQAVSDGTLTQEQADWMAQRGGGRMMGAGRGQGMRGTGQGQFSNPDCPYYGQTQP
ncbi:MAG: hypothetical protein ABIJ65_14225 [Chloroflexota bacterium]